MEIVSERTGAERVTLRLVEIAAPRPGEARRGPHMHDFEECIHVLAGEGEMESDGGTHRVAAGDTILVPAGERHVTRNTGSGPLRLLCFFPAGDVAAGTREFASWSEAGPAS
jgi:quercetin dioxygenase-like cupin family protein